MLSFIKSIFSGGTVKSMEKIATELIDTDLEKAEAKALMVKILDPNGLMRRNISRRVTNLYTLYIVVALLLLAIESLGFGGAEISVATDKVKELFTPITGIFGMIVAASFGIKRVNAYRDNKNGNNKKDN